MSTCKSFRMLAMAWTTWSCWDEELAYIREEEACHWHRGCQIPQRSSLCVSGKITRAKHPSKTIMTTSRPFELLHMDLFAPTHYAMFTSSASLYGFVIVDDYSRYTWVHIITYKTEVQEVFRQFFSRATTNFGMKIKHI